MPMDKQQATEFVLKEFKRQRHRNDIIMSCAKRLAPRGSKGSALFSGSRPKIAMRLRPAVPLLLMMAQ